jgi:hypothetical protein
MIVLLSPGFLSSHCWEVCSALAVYISCVICIQLVFSLASVRFSLSYRVRVDSNTKSSGFLPLSMWLSTV